MSRSPLWRVTGARADLVQLLGCRIVRIGDMPIEEAYTRVAPVISHENDAWLKQQFPSYAIYADVLKTVGVIASLDSAEWTFEALGGDQFSLDIATIPQGSISGIGLPDHQGFTPLYAQNTAQNYWYTYLESTRTRTSLTTSVPTPPISRSARSRKSCSGFSMPIQWIAWSSTCATIRAATVPSSIRSWPAWRRANTASPPERRRS